jgi:hypothetical protein
MAPLARSSSNPDFTSDRVALDARNLTEKLIHVKNFWQSGLHSALSKVANNMSSQSEQPIISQPPKEEDEDNMNDGRAEGC